MDEQMTISLPLRKLAEQIGDEVTEDMGKVAFYFHVCTALAEAGHARISKDDLAQVTLIAFQRRQDRFPKVPILNAVGVYAQE
ncbi:hypothetical protein [Futiania mangrovi]|uniref:Uncharacterized protein n=1 Tax=Futiania mangrovi TaxID=2959716 RepID=A0A9J6PC20_9PROT|nr:hypothetical protein [Futiania mangrovii]MCP1335147.1 hypothetical protein [Futiania mangrovii]